MPSSLIFKVLDFCVKPSRDGYGALLAELLDFVMRGLDPRIHQGTKAAR
ncbi:MAG: hypothetical protein HZA66_06170 [Rhodopseudomonas palustris]|uniref:Uncharacterized protein n=1 Tax=Rhodopseudomonas palustris TaxID=1076 RepID=A0A933W186_RHOPL|nr:hypothetical protein [Rhodopseudomonas palustris]